MAASDSGEHSLKLRIEIENCLSTLQQNLLISGNNISTRLCNGFNLNHRFILFQRQLRLTKMAVKSFYFAPI